MALIALPRFTAIELATFAKVAADARKMENDILASLATTPPTASQLALLRKVRHIKNRAQARLIPCYIDTSL